MKQFSKELGKVSITPKGNWDSSITNERLDIVYDRRNNQAYIAKQDVPIGVDIDNREYWQPLNVSGYADNNFINLTAENENGTITAYESLEEAVATIFPINRRVGATLSFYNLNSDRLDRQAEFELWQFNSTDLANWENKDYWNNIYYNWNVFAGWYIDADTLKNHVEIPNVGQYAYVGSNLNDAFLYQCRTNGTWTNTGIKVRNYISVVVSGNITIGDNGNWFSDGKDTGISATPAVDEQIDNIIVQLQQHSRNISKIEEKNIEQTNRIESLNETVASNIANLNKLNDTVYPITLGFNISSNVGTMKTSINYSIVSDNKPLVPDVMKISKQVNDNTAIVLLDAPASSGSLTTNIEGSREIFKFEVSKTGRTGKSTSITRYLCYYGSLPSSTIYPGFFNSLTKVSTGNVYFNPTITNKDGEHLFLVVPNYLNIKRVTSAGFNVTMADPVLIANQLGTFKVYITTNPLTPATWNLVIS